MTKTHDLLIGKEWRKSANTVPVVNPFTQKAFAEVCLAGEHEIEQATALAEKAFQATRTQPAYLRSRICTNIAHTLRERSEEFAQTISLESGKPLTYARAEVARSSSTFEIAAQEALRLDGKLLTLDITEAARGKAGLTRRLPIGPVAGI